MSHPFEGKIAVVTGGASGIGRSLCEALCRAGATVIVADIDVGAAQGVEASLRQKGYQARAAYVDVADAEITTKLVADTVSDFGRIDYMFNNAAATATRGELRGLPLDPWKRAIDVNLFGVVHGTVAAYEVMVRQGHGHIVNTGSLAGLVGFPTSIPYGASKSAVVDLSTSLRIEAEDLGVKVSVVCPGPVHGASGLIGTDRAAALMLKGVAANKAMIVFPFSARFLWWLYRLSPTFVFHLGRNYVRGFRRKHQLRRNESPTPSETRLSA